MTDAIWDRVAVALAEPPSTVVPPCSPIEAYLGATADIRPLLLDGDPAIVSHVIGIEELLVRWLRGERVEVPDHSAVRSDADVEAWDATVREVVRTAEAADPAERVIVYGLPVDPMGALVLRTFELWTHEQDLRRSVPATDPRRLALMSSRLAAVLPLAVAARGVAAPGRTARLVLTGVAPGCFDVPLDPSTPAGEPDVTIVADVTDVCRIAARRLPSVTVDAVYEGDESLGQVLLAAADAFAQD